MRTPTYTAEEDALIVKMRSTGMTFPDIAKAFPGRSEGAIYQRYYRLVHGCNLPGRRKPPNAPPPPVKERTCLLGGHAFYARIDQHGRFLEYSCHGCKKNTPEVKYYVYA